MKDEVESAATFMANFTRGLTSELKETFRRTLSEAMCSHYQDHWFPKTPIKGTAYRCIRINQSIFDPILVDVCQKCELSEDQMSGLFPSDLTVWVDPQEVSYRIGEDGSIGICFEGKHAEPTSAPSSSDSFVSRSCRSEVQAMSTNQGGVTYRQFVGAMSHYLQA
jgi:protein Tob/BTG